MTEPKSLRDVIEQWRRHATRSDSANQWDEGYNDGLETAARDLERRIEGETERAEQAVSRRWQAKAADNLAQWGPQSVPVLLLAMQEEQGELAQAYLEAEYENGDASRISEELADLGALCFQLHDRLERDSL